MRSFLFMAAAAPEIYTLSLHDALPIWSDHVRGRAAQAHAEADRRPDRRGHERQHLPLRDLHADPRGRQAGGGEAGRDAMNAPVDRMTRPAGDASFARPLILANVSRRRFLQGIS